MADYLVKQARVINQGKSETSDVLIVNGRIERIAPHISKENNGWILIDAEGLLMLPGVIDDQVHFREPGFTHKANIFTESRAAVAGGVTSFMEMPNTNPQATTIDVLEDKYTIGQRNSLANYSFYLGATNTNLSEVQKMDPKTICGIKIFMGSSTGNMLVDNEKALSDVFANAPAIIALHCEDEATIRKNLEQAQNSYGSDIPIQQHPIIRNNEACYLSSSKAVELARKHNARIHILHISTAEEIALFSNEPDVHKKKITTEVCVHHLTFNSDDYQELGSKIKCNPAIKTPADQTALWKALNEGYFDVIATDHAPHTMDEKNNNYLQSPSGLPLIQHTLLLMLDHVQQGRITIEKMVERMCHKPAELFDVDQRGFIKEGYWADLVLVDPTKQTVVSKQNILYKCGWSPLEGKTFNHAISHTFVSGHLAYENGVLHEQKMGERLQFNR
jgi:dihydroorotase